MSVGGHHFATRNQIVIKAGYLAGTDMILSCQCHNDRGATG